MLLSLIVVMERLFTIQEWDQKRLSSQVSEDEINLKIALALFDSSFNIFRIVVVILLYSLLASDNLIE